MGVEKFLDEDGFLEEALEYEQLESRCEMCDHYLGDNACEAYKMIPSKIWNENIYEKVVIKCYVDSDWGGYTASRKNIYGWIIPRI